MTGLGSERVVRTRSSADQLAAARRVVTFGAAPLRRWSAPRGEICVPHTDGGHDAPEQPSDRLLW
jgi:hypothetical protein